MAEDDFTVRINVAGETGTGTSGTKGEEAIASGTAKGFKIAGIVGLLTSLTIVTNTIGIAMGLIQVGVVALVSFLGGLFGQFILKVIPFFQDPYRALLQLGIFIINGIISGLELGLNAVVGAINLVIKGINALIPGSRFDIPTLGAFELPRFQQDLVLKAYDEYKEKTTELAMEGKENSSDAFQATNKFLRDLGNSFMKNSEYQELLNEQALQSQNNTTQSLSSIDSLAGAITAGSTNGVTNMSTAFNSLDKLAQTIERKSRELMKSFGYSSRTSSMTSSQVAINNALKQSTTLSDKEAKSGLYLLNKLSGA